MSKRRGLPTTVRMRHDSHFVEELAAQQITTIGQMVPADQLQPNPHQPRQAFEALEELVASIRRVGVLEPLLVRRAADGYEIISGERRYRAARVAELEELPCIVLDVDDTRALEIALIENLQREDLSPFEEAEGLQALVDQFGFTHDEVAERISKSRTTVTETLSLAGIPREVRRVLEEGEVRSKSLLLELARFEDPERMRQLAERIIQESLTRDDLRKIRREGEQAEETPDGQEAQDKRRTPRRITFRSRTGITVSLYFSSDTVSPSDVERTLLEAIRDLRSNGIPEA